MAKKAQINTKALRKQLEERRLELQEITATSRATRKPVELDQSMQGRLSRMDALQQREMALETQRRREIELSRIEAALKRIDTEDFGYCVSCDEDIAPGRLKSDPSEPLCVECAGSVRS